MPAPPITARRSLLLVLAAAVAIACPLISAGGAAQAAPRTAIALARASQPFATATPSTVDPHTSVGKAWNWIFGQLGSGTTITSSSVIAAEQTYPSDWTGAVFGTFTPRGVVSPVAPSASIVLDEPIQIAGGYAGPVGGHITLPVSANRWIVQVYRDTGSGRVQEPLQTLVAPDGTFSLDLGSIANPSAGTWALGLLDAANSYAPTGTPWPADTYSDWHVNALVVTDTAYLVGQQPARADGSFSFASSRPGTKVFQLVDNSTGAVLAEQAPDFGLVRSYASGTRVYAYDQALAVLTAGALGVDAPALTAGLISMQDSGGGFRESADVRNPAAGVAIVRTGISAIATYALLRRLQAMDSSDPNRPMALSAARTGVTWLLNQRRPDGLLDAGRGDYRADGTLDTTASPGWVSTEHNIDAWQTLQLASSVLGDASYAAAATALDTSIVSLLWRPSTGRFQQGVADDGSADNADPLDVSSWGALFLLEAGHTGLAAQAIAHMNAFASSTAGATGYRAYYPQPAFADAPANVWAEGSAGVVTARARTGDEQQSETDLANLATLQHSDGSLPYATQADDATSMTTDSSVTATAWYVLASLSHTATPIW